MILVWELSDFFFAKTGKILFIPWLLLYRVIISTNVDKTNFKTKLKNKRSSEWFSKIDSAQKCSNIFITVSTNNLMVK